MAWLHCMPPCGKGQAAVHACWAWHDSYRARPVSQRGLGGETRQSAACAGERLATICHGCSLDGMAQAACTHSGLLQPLEWGVPPRGARGDWCLDGA